jgi:hypothetical protein
VASRALASVGYDEVTMELDIEFRSGRVYRYRAVPRGVLDWLLRSKNMGAFVTRMIVGRYVTVPIDEEQALPSGADREGVGAGAPPSLEQVLRASLARLSDPERS